MKIKKNDTIKVISGDDRGKTGTVLKAFPRQNKVLVDGVGAYKKHLKKNLKNQEGGVVTLYRPIQVSNVVLVAKAAKPKKKTVVKLKK